MDETSSATSRQRSTRRPAIVLAALCAADFLVVLDGLILAVALPAIKQDLAIPAGSLQWVVTAYLLCFGGFLLLGGRLGDVYGRRRVLLIGLLLFAVGSLLAGLAWAPAALLAGRALQGLGAAAMAPTALALLTDAFPDQGDRDRALGVWSAVGSAGIPAGALLGGLLTATVGWRWVLLVNVPAALAAAALTRAVVEESETADRPPRPDWAGAALVTTGLAALLMAVSQVGHVSSGTAVWGRVVLPSVLGLACLRGFVVVERRAPAPLVPLGRLRTPSLLTASLTGLVLPVGLGAALFLATLYLQQVVGIGPLATGLAYLALAVPCITASPLASRMADRLGRRATAAAGLLLQIAGLLLLSGVRPDGTIADVLPGFVLIGLGAPIAFVPTTATAMMTSSRDTGLASGIFNTSQQLGNAVALAAIATLAASWTAHLADGMRPDAVALTGGYAAGFLLAAGLAAAGLLPALCLTAADRFTPRRRAAGSGSRP